MTNNLCDKDLISCTYINKLIHDTLCSTQFCNEIVSSKRNWRFHALSLKFLKNKSIGTEGVCMNCYSILDGKEYAVKRARIYSQVY